MPRSSTAAEAAAWRAIEAVWRIESARLIATLARLTKNLGEAEDLAQEALVAALEAWPQTGIPDNPGAWLTQTGKHRAVDRMRRAQRLSVREEQMAAALEPRPGAEQDALAAQADDQVGDELLGLVLACCHPVLSREARVTLTLRVLGGLTTEEIARAFVLPGATIGQRISRAKRTLAEHAVTFEVPRGSALQERLPEVLEVVYLVFNEGYAATAGEDWMRPTLCREALRLARVLQGLVPGEPEVHGLAALLELQGSRLDSRTRADGTPVPLLEQDRSRWDLWLIGRGLTALDRVAALGGDGGAYALQAAIAACHARARRPERTDWPRIAELYDELSLLARSPIVDLNRAVALGMAGELEAGLELIEAIDETGVLAGYHLLPAARGDLLMRLGRGPEAAAAFSEAADQTENRREAELLRARAAEAAGA